jgi:hypothetical protein
MREKGNLLQEEKLGKFRILHMEMSASKRDDFNLTDSVSQFINDYQLDHAKISLNSVPPKTQ